MNLHHERNKLDKLVALAIKQGKSINTGEVLKQSKLVDMLIVKALNKEKEKRLGA